MKTECGREGIRTMESLSDGRWLDGQNGSRVAAWRVELEHERLFFSSGARRSDSGQWLEWAEAPESGQRQIGRGRSSSNGWTSTLAGGGKWVLACVLSALRGTKAQGPNTPLGQDRRIASQRKQCCTAQAVDHHRRHHQVHAHHWRQAKRSFKRRHRLRRAVGVKAPRFNRRTLEHDLQHTLDH